MPQKLSAHPDKDSLMAFGLGQLQPNEATAIESHLEECHACCETLLDLKDDTFIALVRQSPEAATPLVGPGSPAETPARTEGAEDRSADQTLVVPMSNEGAPAGLPQELANHPRYRIVELIGRGGMGEVYKAEHRLMNRTVALKVINHELVRNTQAVERFRREVQAAARLAHPNIVTAHDAEQAGGVHYLVMEYVDGTELSEVVRKRGPLDVSRACDFIAQAAAGLQHAHAQGMVHRDIKPHNLMVTAEGRVKILDFGLATLADPVRRSLEPASSGDESVGAARPHDLTSAGTVMGTPDFISPEQAGDARSVDIRADIYSLGCTLYYLLAGRPPFNEGSAMDRMKAHADAVAEPLESIRVDVPAELAEVVRRMMAKDPTDRFQSPAEVADALAPFVDEHRTGAAAAASGAGRNRRRWPVVAAAAAFLLAGVAAIIYVKTDRGTLVIESVDESVQVVLSETTGDSGGTEARIVDTVSGSTVRTLPSGAYEVRLAGGESEFELNTRRVVLRRGGEVVVKVTRKAPGEADMPAVAEKPDETPAARPDTREELREFLDAAREATSEDEWKTFVAAYAPMLFKMPLEESRGLIELLAGLPEKTTETLLQRGYLRWKATSLEEVRQAAVRGILAAFLSRAPSALPEHTSEEQLRARLAQNDTGFIVLDLPDSNDQVVAWYLLDRKHEFPVILTLSGSTPEATRDLLKPEVRGQVTALLERPYSELPPGPVAQSETRQALEQLLAAAPEEAADEQWKAFLQEYAAPLAEIPLDVSRELIQLTAGLPGESRAALLREGYLKWRFRALDAARQDSIRTLYRQILAEAPPQLEEDKIDLMVRMLQSTSVGFAVVSVPETPKQVIVWYVLMPNSPVPIMLPVSGATSKDAGAILSRPVYDQLSELEDKPYSELPAPPDTRAEIRKSLNALIEAARRASTDEDWRTVIAEHAPMLAPGDTEAEAAAGPFDETSRTLFAESARDLVNLLAELPDEVHSDLLRTGYLKWRFRSLNESRQAAMETFLKGIIAATRNMGFPPDLHEDVPALLASGDVGFAVLNLPDGNDQVLSWYLLMPDAPLPMMFPILGRPGGTTDSVFDKSLFRQIEALEDKPYSGLKSLLHAADMERLQGLWQFVRGQANGQPVNPRQLEVAANVWLMKDPQTRRTLERMTFEIDPTQYPKHITLENTAPRQTIKAIYRFDGDELHVAAPANPAGERPKSFEAEGENLFVVIMRREPPPDTRRMNMEAALKESQAQRDGTGEIAYAIWESNGHVVLRFANWYLLFDGIDAEPGLGGLGSFRVPREGIDDSKRTGGGATFWSNKPRTPLKVSVDDRIVDGKSTISVNGTRFNMHGRAETLVFGDASYSASDRMQTIVIARDGTTTLRVDESGTQPETGQAFEQLLAAVPQEATKEEWKAFLREYAPVLAEFPPEISRELIQLTAGLPGESHAALLHEGYLKWPFPALDVARQESTVALYRQVLSGVQPELRRYILGEASSALEEDKIDLLIRLLESASVGFAVVRVPQPPKQIIVWYILLPNSEIQSLQPRRRSVEGGPIMLPVSGATPENAGSIPWRVTLYRQLLDLEDKPDSDLPEPQEGWIPPKDADPQAIQEAHRDTDSGIAGHRRSAAPR